jgi:hypothetical protein
LAKIAGEASNIDESIETANNENMDSLILSMHDFRRNCKKRKQKKSPSDY